MSYNFKRSVRPAEPLQSCEAKLLLEVAGHNRKRFAAYRDVAVLAILWRSQLRISECLSLRLVDYEVDRLRVLHGKGAKPRVVGLDAGTSELIEDWLPYRVESKWLFCTGNGNKVHPSHYRRLFKKLQSKCKINKRCHPHGMRHTGACELAKERVPLHFISAQLGHSSTSYTDDYLRSISGEEVVNIIGKRKW